MRLGDANALAPLALLGVLSGAAAGALILAFRAVVEGVLGGTISSGDPEGFEQLPASVRFALPIIGALLVAALFRWMGKRVTQVGVVHVMERLAYHQGNMPLSNTVAQFVGAVISLCSGHSMGREGPGVHLGAAAGSWVGHGLGVPNNSMRTLIACGTAASIAASFNTPIAGVIFAMEVVMMEYTIAGFTPVILASAVAAWMSQAVHGDAAAFTVPTLNLGSLLELPYIVFVGAVIGLFAALFVGVTRWMQTRVQAWSVWVRFALAGTATGAIAVFVPAVMGIGYDTVEATLVDHFGLYMLMTIFVAKLFASIACVGFGLPAGLIAPTLFLGATAGAALGGIGQELAPDLSADPGFYAILGMGAMMGACLHAPLAALMAMLELTANVNIILPGMVCIVSAVLVARTMRTEAIFVTLLRVRGADYTSDPIALALSRSGISTRMSAHYELHNTTLPGQDGWQRFAESDKRWIIFEGPDSQTHVFERQAITDWLLQGPSDETGDLARPVEIIKARLTVRATVQEARERLGATGAEVLVVRRMDNRICGIVTADMLGATVPPPGSR